MMANPNVMVLDWVLTVMGEEEDSIPWRILLTITLPLLPIYWLFWWIGYLVAEVLI